MKALINILRGINIPPAWVGFARGLVEAAAIAAVGAVINEIQLASVGTDKVIFAAAAVGGLRWLEGIVDHIDAVRQRKPEE